MFKRELPIPKAHNPYLDPEPTTNTTVTTVIPIEKILPNKMQKEAAKAQEVCNFMAKALAKSVGLRKFAINSSNATALPQTHRDPQTNKIADQPSSMGSLHTVDTNNYGSAVSHR